MRCSTGRVSSSGLFCVRPTKVKARKSFLFTEGSLKVRNKEYLVDLVVTLHTAKDLRYDNDIHNDKDNKSQLYSNP